MSETRTVSPTLEERLAAVLDAAVQIDDERGFHTGNLKSPTYAKFILAAAKEHGLVIGEGELDGLRELSEAATPGPWVAQSPDDGASEPWYIDTHAYPDGPEPVWAATYPISEADVRLITAAVNYVRERLRR